MKKALKKIEYRVCHIKDGVRIEGVHSDLRGNVSGLIGDVSNLSGYVSGLRGDVSGLSGYVSGLIGYVSGLRGDIDSCKLTDEDRARGVDVSELLDK